MTIGRAEAISVHLDSDSTDLPFTLPPIAALREVVAVCDSIATGHQAPHKANRKSLGNDMGLALAAIGPKLKRSLQPALKSFRNDDLAKLSDLLGESPGSAQLGAAAAGLLELLRQPRNLRLAWEDIVDGHDDSLEIDEVRHRAVILRELDEGLGHEWRWRKGTYRALLAEDHDRGDWQVIEAPPSAPEVAWFVFANADLAEDALRVGQIQFFSSRLWPEAVVSSSFYDGRDGVELPGELDEEALEHWFSVTDGAESHVYARVELTGPRVEPSRTPGAQGRAAETWARELVTAVVEAGTFRRGGSNWRLLEGVSLYHGTIADEEKEHGNWSGTGSFEDPRYYEEVRRYRNPLLEGTGEALSELDPRFAELLAEADTGAKLAVEEVRWYEATRDQPDPAQRLVLRVRAFERALPVSEQFHWDEAVARYLRAFWALDEFNNELFHLAHTTNRILIHAGVDRPAAMEDWLVEGKRGAFSIFLGTFLRQAHAIHSLVPNVRRIERRRVKAAGRWQKHPREARARIERWEQRFSQLLARALRQRNATVHGTQTVPEVVATVDGFIARLAAFVVAQAIESTTDGTKLVGALEKGRIESEREIWRLEQGGEPTSDVLYKPENL